MADVNKIIDKVLNLPKPWRVSEVKFDHALKTVDIYLSYKKGSLFPCPTCDDECPIHDTKERTWRHLDLFDYKTMLHAKVPRVKCERHGVKMVDLKWSEKGSNFTFQFEAMVLSFAKEMSVAAVANLVRIHPDSVWRILERYIREEVYKMDLSGVRIVGVDEVSIGKGHQYMTIFGDLSGDEPKVIFIIEGRDATTIEAFKERLGETFVDEWARYMVFSIDMSKPYIAGIKEHFPKAETVFDRYHVMVNVNKAVDDTRREESWEKKTLLGTRYLWLKNPENLTDKQLEELESIKDLDLKTARAYHIKTALQRVWKFEFVSSAEKYLKKWYYWATHSKLRFMIKVGRMIKAHWDGILNSIRYKVTNGPIEGLVNKIRTAIKRAYGFKTFRNLRTIIYLIAGDIKLPTRS